MHITGLELVVILNSNFTGAIFNILLTCPILDSPIRTCSKLDLEVSREYETASRSTTSNAVQRMGIADIDECAENNGGCRQNCINQIGDYQCSCVRGFYRDDDGKRCHSKIR